MLRRDSSLLCSCFGTASVSRFRSHPVSGGAKISYHLSAKAADIRVTGMITNALYEIAQSVPGLNGFELDHNFLQVDIRATPAKWAYGNGKVIAA